MTGNVGISGQTLNRLHFSSHSEWSEAESRNLFQANAISPLTEPVLSLSRGSIEMTPGSKQFDDLLSNCYDILLEVLFDEIFIRFPRHCLKDVYPMYVGYVSKAAG